MNAKPRTGTFVALAAALTLALAPAIADARPGKGGSFGSRGARTFDAPAATTTAPRAAAPMERSATPTPSAQRPAAGVNAPAARPGFAGRGGFMGGLLGAGLFGLLLGYGLSGGLGGFASILGLLIQVALVGFLAMLAFRWFQRRQQPAYAGAPAGAGAGMSGPLRREAQGGLGGLGGLGRGTGGLGAAGAAPGAASGAARRPAERRDDLGIGPSDYEAFEKLLVGLQDAYSREDAKAIRTLATPEMTGYFAEELEANAARGVVNRLGDVKLLAGDLAEAWREQGAEYATVAMRFSLRDWTEDRGGRVVEGDPNRPEEATEVWTFRRMPGGPWLISAIQQT
jgi:predicted lipid-binding transport protein (Tim44 family)